MFLKTRSILFFIICFVILFSLATKAQDVYNARSGRVFDGDSLLIKKSGESKWRDVRLLGIDAPEKGQDYANEATAFLRRSVRNKQLRIEVLKKDVHGRELVTIFVDDTDINLQLLEAGYAWFNRPFGYELRRRMRNIYKDAANEAKRLRLGLWVDNQPVAPWTFRRQSRSNSIKGDLRDNVCSAYLSGL